MQDEAATFFDTLNDCYPHSLVGTCTHQYILQPWTNPELASCNPHNLTTVCSVTASESFTLEWYYSKLSSNAGRSGRVLNDIGENYFVELPVKGELQNGAFRMSSHLTIINVTSNEFGYYWCMVKVRNSDMILPNPSRILHLSNICASVPVCNSSIQLYQQWPNDSCANEDNKNITLPGTLQCNQPTSTPDNVASIQPTRTEHLMNSSTTLPLQTVTGNRAPGLEDKMETSIKLLSPHSTIVYTESLPTDVVSGGDSDTRLIVAIVMAVVLTAIAVILILIICIQCKKCGVRSAYMKLSRVTCVQVPHLIPVDPCHTHFISENYCHVGIMLNCTRCSWNPQNDLASVESEQPIVENTIAHQAGILFYHTQFYSHKLATIVHRQII